jgi:AAA15 family ATPase/GTPase
MLIAFSVSNFRSIRDREVLNLQVASNHGKGELLKILLIWIEEWWNMRK